MMFRGVSRKKREIGKKVCGESNCVEVKKEVVEDPVPLVASLLPFLMRLSLMSGYIRLKVMLAL